MGGEIRANNNMIRLGKNAQNQVNLDNLKAGVKLDSKTEAIFKKFDQNNNGILEQNELDALKESLAPYTDDGVLSKGEAKKVLKCLELKGLKSEELFEFLQSAQINSDEIENSFYSLFDDVQALCIKYKKDKNGVERTTAFNQDNGVKIQDIYKSESGETVTIRYAEDGESVTSKETKKGALTTVEDGSGRVLKQTTSKGQGLQETVEYEYEGDSKTPSKITTTKMDGTVVVTDGAGNPIEPSKTETPETEDANDGRTVFENGRILIKGENSATIQEPGKEPVEIKYDSDGNILSNAKNGESFTQTAKRLGITPGTPEFDKFKELNSKAAKNGWFQVGAEVKIPAGMEDKINLDGVNVDAKAESKKFENAAIRNADISKYNESNTEMRTLDKNTTWWALAKDSLIAEGIERPTDAQISTRTNELMKLNSGKQPAKGVEVILPKTPQAGTETVVPETGESAPVETPAAPADSTGSDGNTLIDWPVIDLSKIKWNNEFRLQRDGVEVAGDLYDDIHAKTKWGLPTTGENFDEHIKDITANNVVDVLKAYDAKSPKESLIEAIFDEIGMDQKKQIASVTHIKDALIARSNNLGVDVSVLNSEFEKAFEDATTGALATVKYIDTEKLDKLVAEYTKRIDAMEKMDKAARERYMEEGGLTFLQLSDETIEEANNSGFNGDDLLGNGLIDSPAEQTGQNCWAHGGLNAIGATPKGKEFLNNLVTKRNGVIAVRLPEAAKNGLPKPNGDGIYTFTELEVLDGIERHSYGDGDVTAIMLAVEQYYKESGFLDGDENPMAGGSASQMFEVLTGQKAKVYAVKGGEMFVEGNQTREDVSIPEGLAVTYYTKDALDNAHYSKLQDMLNNGDGALYINFKENVVEGGATDATTLDRGMNEGDGESPFISRHHAYAVTQMDNDFVYLVESTSPNMIIKMSKQEFMEKVEAISTYKF